MVDFSVTDHDRNRWTNSLGVKRIPVVPTGDVEEWLAHGLRVGLGIVDIATGGDRLDVNRRGDELVARQARRAFKS